MAIKYGEFTFPSDGKTSVKGYERGGRREPMAKGGLVTPPKSGIRPPRLGNAERAQKYAEGMAMRPNRGPRIGAKLDVAKPAKAPGMPMPSAPPVGMGALQSAGTPPGIPTTPDTQMKKGGRIKEGSKADMAEDRRGAAKAGMSMDDYEKSPADEKADKGQYAKGGRLNAAKRNALPKSDFGLPASRGYPMPDQNHARVALSRASQAVNAGRMSKSTEEKIDSKANRILKG